MSKVSCSFIDWQALVLASVCYNCSGSIRAAFIILVEAVVSDVSRGSNRILVSSALPDEAVTTMSPDATGTFGVNVGLHTSKVWCMNFEQTALVSVLKLLPNAVNKHVLSEASSKQLKK